MGDVNDPFVAFLLLSGIILPTLIALWARAWHRRPLVWALITFFATPFAFLFVALALLLKGRSRTPEPA
jgi:RsiW-degrading membrane proteinase PrsW (M82 family)